MKTALLLAALLLPSATEARRYEASSFDDLMDLTAGHIQNLDALQAEAEKPFLEVAPRCLNNWTSYAAAYDRLHRELGAAAEPALRDIQAYLREANGLNVGSPGLTLGEACGLRGEVIHSHILRKRKLARELHARLAETRKEVNRLHAEAWRIFEVEAPAKDFGRNLGCLFRYQYIDVMRIALFRDYYPRGEQSPPPALYQLRDDLERTDHFLDKEEKELSDNLVRLNSLRLSCRR